MARFNADIDGSMLQKFKEEAVKDQTTMSEIIKNFINNWLIEREEQARPRISIISHSIAATATNTLEKEKKLSSEDERALIIKNLLKAVKEAAPIIADMDVSEFLSEIKTPVVDEIYRYRSPVYKQRIQRQASSNDPHLKKMLQHEESALLPQQPH